MIIAYLLLLPFCAAFLSPILVKKIPGNGLGWLFAIFPLLIVVLVLTQNQTILRKEAVQFSLSWFKAMNIAFAFRMDGLSQLFVLLIGGIGVPIVIYSKPYFEGKSYLTRYYFLLFLFMGAMIGAVCANDLVTLFLFWELTSICSFLLIGLNHHNKTARKAAVEALFVTTLGGVCLLASFILMSMVSGGQQIDQLLQNAEVINSHPYGSWILFLLLIGAFTKSAQFPFSFWLPAAMQAPVPVSAYLHSATMVQLGIYLLARFHFMFADTRLWFISLTTIGGLTMLTSALAAFKHFDMKRILAYTTVTALGSQVFILAGTNEVVVKAAISFLIVHALYKANLFMAVGDIQHQTGSRHLKEVSGLASVMPVTFLSVGIAGLSMAGIPPLLGFYVKELVYEASLAAPVASYILTFIVVLANMMMAAIAFMLFFEPFWGKQKPLKVFEANVNMSVNSLILACVTLSVSVFTQHLDLYVLSPASSAILGHKVQDVVQNQFITGPSFVLSLLTLSGAVLLYTFRKILRNLLIMSNVLKWIFPHEILQAYLVASLWFATKWTDFWQSGILSRYIFITVLSMVFLLCWQLDITNNLSSINQDPMILWGLFIWMTCSSTALVFAKQFISGVICLSVFGLGLTFFFVVQGAPDLAMTQVLIEILLLILIIYCIYRLKYWPDAKPESMWHRISRGVVAVSFGIFVALTLNAISLQPFDHSLQRYFINNSSVLCFGKNVVNVILVDFRALDTLGEAVVVLIAALGIGVLLHKNSGKNL